MTKQSKLANPTSPQVRDALRRPCPYTKDCGAQPGEHCRGLGRRLVHYARCSWKTEPSL